MDMMDTDDEIMREARDLLVSAAQAEKADDVVDFIDRCMSEARIERQDRNVLGDIELGDCHASGRYTSSELARLAAADMGPGSGLDVFTPVTPTKCQALEAWLADVFSPAVDKPFTLLPTPLPDLPRHMEDAAVEQIARMVETGDLDTAEVADAAAQARQIVADMAETAAREATRRMENTIQDTLLEGCWRDTFAQFLTDLPRYPAAILCGPVVQRSRELRWDAGEVREVETAKFVMRRVHPRRFFPAPDSDTVADAPWVIEVRSVTRPDLARSREAPGFRRLAVEALLADRQGYSDPYLLSEGAYTDGPEDDAASGFDVRVFVGEVPRSMLIRAGVVEESADDPAGLGHEFVEMWVCDGRILRAVIDPWPRRRKPYYVAGFRRVPGCVWFESMPRVLRDTQRKANAAGRALVKNVGVASGPVIEVDSDSLAHEEDFDDVQPWRVYKTMANPLRGSAPAVRINAIPSVAPHLLQVVNHYSLEADDVSGVPAYVAGDPSVQGAGRTLGGLAMLMGNAAKGLKKVVGTIDNLVIQPMVEMLYDLNMLYNDDTSIKADVRVIARGASGLLQRELTQSRAMELLQLVLNPAIVQSGVVPPEAVPNLLREVAASLGYDPDIVAEDPQAQAALVAAMQQAGLRVMQEQGTGTQGAVYDAASPAPPAPGLDGRQAPRVPGAAGEVAAAGIAAASPVTA